MSGRWMALGRSVWRCHWVRKSTCQCSPWGPASSNNNFRFWFWILIRFWDENQQQEASGPQDKFWPRCIEIAHRVCRSVSYAHFLYTHNTYEILHLLNIQPESTVTIILLHTIKVFVKISNYFSFYIFCFHFVEFVILFYFFYVYVVFEFLVWVILALLLN